MQRWRTGIVILAALAGAVVATLFVLPAAVRVLAERRVEALTGREVTVGDVDLNLFTRRLVARDVRVHAPGGETAPLTLERLSADFELAPLLRGRMHLHHLALAGLDVYLQRTAGGHLNVSDVIEHIAARPRGEPVATVIDTLVVTGSRVRLQDRAIDPHRTWVLGEVALEAHDIVTVGDAADGRASATFILAGAPGTLEVQRLGIRPLQARAALTVDGLDLAAAAPYFPADAAVRLAGGRVTSELRVDYDAAGTLRASGEASGRDVVVARVGQDPPLVSVPDVMITVRDLAYADGDVPAGDVTLTADRVTVLDARAPRARPLDVTALRARWNKVPDSAPDAPGRFAVTADLPHDGRLRADGTAGISPPRADVTIELDALDVALAQGWIPADAEIQPSAGRLAGTVELRYAETDGLVADGRLRVDGLAVARAGQRAPFVRDERIVATVRGLTLRDGVLTLGGIAIDGSPTLTDARVTPAHRVQVSRLRAAAEGGAIPGGPPSRLRLDATLSHGGRLAARGTGSLAPASLSLDVRAIDVDLAVAAPYVPPRSPVALRQGRLDAQLSVAWDGALRGDGRVVARDLTLLRRGQAEPFIHHPSLEATVTGLVLRDGQLRVERLALHGAPTLVDASASPPQRFDFQSVGLTVEDFTWPGQRPARVQGRLSAADGGRGTVTGTVHPTTLATDVRGHFENLDVARAQGYVGAAPLDIVHGLGDVTVTLRHRRAGGVRLDAEGAVRELALRLTTGPGMRVEDPRITFRVNDLVVRDGTTSLRAAAVDGTPAVGREEAAAPPSRLHAELGNFRWPAGPPAPWRVRLEPADGGHLTADGTLTPGRSWALAGTLQAEDAGLAPLAPLLPLQADVAGRLDGRVQGAVGRDTPMAFEGTLTINDVRIDPPDTSALRIGSVRLEDATLGPHSLTAARLTLEAPILPVERTEDGRFPLRAMLRPAPYPAASPAETTDVRRRAAAPSGEEADFRFAVEEVVVRDGHVRFIDRTTTPNYSEEITRLTATITDLDNTDDAPATVAIQGIVGVDAALDLHGEVAAFAAPFFLDVRGELRDFAVPRTNPYLQRFLDWIARRGQLSTQVHYRIVGGELTASNEILVERLDVERAADQDRSDRLVGVPLGLAVALLKDTRGDIRVSVPVSGDLRSPQFHFGDAIRGALVNVLQRLVTAPFRALGAIFRRDGEAGERNVTIPPVEFEPASSVLTHDGRVQLQRVADVVRASPYIRLALQPIVSEEDLRALRAQDVVARIQRVQREQGLDEFAAAARQVWAAARPGIAPPEEPDAIVRELAGDEPAPTEAAQRLGATRLAVTRTYLAETAGIQPDRLLEAPGPASIGAPRDGGVAFALRPADR